MCCKIFKSMIHSKCIRMENSRISIFHTILSKTT